MHDVPDQYGEWRRPPHPLKAIPWNPIEYCWGLFLAQLVVLPVWFVQACYSIVTTGSPPHWPAIKSTWIYVSALGFLANLGAVAWDMTDNLREHQSHKARYPIWLIEEEARQKAKMAEAARLAREREEARIAELRRLDAEALAARQRRIGELEMLVLRTNAQHAMDRDFDGTGDPGQRLQELRQDLAKLAVADLGLLRESRNQTVQKVIGNGQFLPATPPFKTHLIASLVPR